MAETLEIKKNPIKKYIPEDKPFVVKLGEGEDIFEVTVKPKLSLVESVAFIKSIINEMFSENDETDTPFATKEYIIKAFTIVFYTDIEDVDDLYDLIYNTNIYDSIMSHEDFNLLRYDELLSELREQIDYEVAKRQNQFKAGTEQLISTVKIEVESILSSFEKIGEVFKDIKPEEMQGLVKSLSSVENLDEKKIANAVLEFRKPSKKRSPKKVEQKTE
jgi:hypothetical protein